MTRARDMLRALQLTLVWLLLAVVPIGAGPLAATATADACASWCPCDEAEVEHHSAQGDEDSPCDEDCSDDCSGCCGARMVMVVGHERPSSPPTRAAPTRGPPVLDSPGCRLATLVFRPPRSLT